MSIKYSNGLANLRKNRLGAKGGENGKQEKGVNFF
jgi:hypothetical protein